MLTIIPVALAFYYAYARLTSTSIAREPFDSRWKIASTYSFFGTLAIAALLRFELDADVVVVAWAVLALLLTAFARRSGRRIFLDQALLIAFAVLFRGIFHNLYQRSYFLAPFAYSRILLLGATIALLLLTLPFAFALRQSSLPRATRNRFAALFLAFDGRPEQVFFFIAFLLSTILLAVEMRSGMVTLAWGVQAFATFALALWVKERSYRLAALALLLLCVVKIVLRDVWGLAPRDRYLTFIVLGSALLAVSYLYTRYRQVLRQYL